MQTWKSLFLLSCTVAFAAPLPPPLLEAPPAIGPRLVRVGITGRFTSVQFSSWSEKSPLRVTVSPDRTVFRRQVTLRALNGALYVENEKAPEISLQLQPSSFSHGILLNGNPYHGSFRVFAENSTLKVVNEVPLEDYVAGVVGSEMPAQWSLEALKAQAIASRSYAAYRMRHPRKTLYDLQDDVLDQRYLGQNAETPRTRRAVRDTEGVILEDPSHRVLLSYFHSRCGGVTESAKEVWRSPSKLKNHTQAVKCAFCRNNPAAWSARIPWTEFTSALKIPPTSHVASLTKTPSGRVDQLEIVWPGKRLEVPSETLRSHFGYSKIKSNRFEVRASPREVEFVGVGAGHGVGLCQWGANHLATQGLSASRILAHYYPTAKVAQLADPALPLSRSTSVQ